MRGNPQQPTSKILTVGGVHLQYSRDECNTVAACFARDRVITPPLIGRRARERLVRIYLPRCRIFHFADHAVYDPQHDNLFGHLKLYEGELLEVHEIYNLRDRLACEAVVLSACETAVGSKRQLETGNSLARAFLAAGTTRVVASLWKVDDPATCRLMSTFFQEVADATTAEPIDYAAALRTAMQRLRSDEDPEMRSPYYWAPFALIGPPHVQPAGENASLTMRN